MEANNMKAMREALDRIGNTAVFVVANCGDKETAKYMNYIIMDVQAALTAPPRQCDVGTPYEQANRMRQFCAKQKRNGIINCGYCPIKHQYQRDCTLAWAQTPYAEEGAGK